jgi:uncharacterized protein (TIGR03000 family)
MYSIVLAMTFVSGNAAPAADFYDDLRDLKRSVSELREEQKDTRIEELKLVIGGLRQRLTDEKLDELRRDIRALRHEEEMFYTRPRAVMLPMPLAVTGATRATVAVDVPAGATFIVNNKEILLPAINPVFVTPPLEPGKDYFYDCMVKVERDGTIVTKTKRFIVHAGEVVRINYADMEPSRIKE